MDLGLAGRACVVTGASRGIGRETARLLCAEGANVLLVARGEERLPRRPRRRPTARSAPQRRARRRPRPRRHRRGRRASACWPPPSERFGALDVLVNNAGAAAWRDLDDVPDEDWRAQYELNVMAPLRAMRAAIPAMAERGWGRVVNVCSTAGKRPSAAMPEYSVAKAAELSLSRLFADRYAKSGVLVNAICPGPGRIGDVDGAGRPARPVARAAAAPTAARRRWPKRAPSGRSAASPRPRRSPRRSSSSAPSAPPTSPAPPGRWTAAPSRSSFDRQARSRRRCCCRSTAGPTRRPGLIFTERRADLRRHAGEISFPGGRRDEADADLRRRRCARPRRRSASTRPRWSSARRCRRPGPSSPAT